MSLLVPERSRTPSGFLYDSPYDLPQPRPLFSLPFKGRDGEGMGAAGWTYGLSMEAGALGTSGDAPRRRDYGDYGSGAVLSHFNLGLERPGTGHYFDFSAGAAGRGDQHYRATAGRYGDFRTSLYYTQAPRLFTDRARTVFRGAGTGSLTLPAGLTPGNNTAAQVDAALQSAPFFELGFNRKNAGLEFDAAPGTDWRVFARYNQERRNGTRPFGGASGYPGSPLVETIEPIDYKTHNVTAGVQWSGERQQANLGYSGSFFRNAIDTLTWENPLVVGDPAVLRRSRMDLYPDNGFHNLKLDLATALPARGRLSGGVSLGRMTQDDALIPHTINSGVLPGAPPVDLSGWNTAAALSRPTANARIDTRLLHLDGSFSPAQDLSLRARLRHYEEDNKTRYTAFNPLTGEFGYLGLDGANNSNIVPGLFRVPVRSIPFEQRKDNYGIEGDYRVLRHTNVTLGYEREHNRLTHRELGSTEEGRWRAALSNRDIEWATVRLSYEQAKRTGDGYDFNPNSVYYGAGVIGAPATLAELRKYDIADRRQQIVNARVNFLVARDMDFAASARYVDNDYGAAYGRLDEEIAGLNLEWNWQPRPGASTYAYYGFQRVRNRMASISDDALAGSPNAGGPVYPLANRWEEESRDDAHTVGLGFRYAFPRATLESAYAWHHAPSRVSYGYASPGALAGGAAAAAEAGAGMPDMLFRQQTLETSLRISLGKDTALRLFHRYEHVRIEDWHYDGLPLVLGGEAVFLGAGPRNYSAHLIGVFYQYIPGKR